MSTGVPGGQWSDAKRRAAIYLAVTSLVILGYALLYQFAMATFEGVQVSYIEALEVVVQTFTTTGYGEDASQWTTDAMFLLTTVMMLTGVVLIFLTLPLFLVPLVEESLRTDPPDSIHLSDHVIICTFTPRGETLVEELESMGVPYVVVEDDRELARDLYTDGYTVVHGDPESVEDLIAAGAESATALVADDTDEKNASIILSAKQVSPDLRVISLIEDPTVADYHEYAGADRIVSPRRLLGESIASKASTTVTTELGGTIEIGEDFEIAELLVQQGSPLVGQSIAESRIRERTGANVIGAWFSGRFASPPSPDDVIDEHTALLVAGRDEQLEALKALTLSETRRHRGGSVIVAGYGEVGSTVADRLTAANVPRTVVDLEDRPGVDVVGDVTDRQTLEKAGVDDARSIVLTVDDDTTAIFATLVGRQVAPDVEIIARANESDSVPKLYRAGAEYVLALSTVSGRMLTSHLFEEEVIAPNAQIEVIRTQAPDLAGQSLAEADVRARTGCTVIAVERDGELITEIGPDLVIRAGDDVVLAGRDEDVYRFNELGGVGMTDDGD
jgi:Trk K+ transport system NAD-binding subunit